MSLVCAPEELREARARIAALECVARRVLAASAKACEDIAVARFAGLENGNGEEVGTELDAALKDLFSAVTDGVDAPAEAVPVDAETTARIDASLGLVTLPPIRVSPEVLAALQAKAQATGVIVQALVRDMLNDAAGVPVRETAADPQGNEGGA